MLSVLEFSPNVSRKQANKRLIEGGKLDKQIGRQIRGQTDKCLGGERNSGVIKKEARLNLMDY